MALLVISKHHCVFEFVGSSSGDGVFSTKFRGIVCNSRNDIKTNKIKIQVNHVDVIHTCVSLPPLIKDSIFSELCSKLFSTSENK